MKYLIPFLCFVFLIVEESFGATPYQVYANSDGTLRTPTNFFAQNLKYVNVKDRGAVGNGVTDDTTAIQGAMNEGVPVYFPDGTYLVSSTLTLGSNATIFGYGSESVILGDTNLSKLIAATNIGNVRIRDLKFGGGATCGIFWDGVTNSLIENCSFTYFNRHQDGNVLSSAISMVGVSNLVIQDNYFLGNGHSTNGGTILLHASLIDALNLKINDMIIGYCAIGSQRIRNPADNLHLAVSSILDVVSDNFSVIRRIDIKRGIEKLSGIELFAT